MKKFIRIACAVAVSAAFANATAAIFVVAHPDDDMLLMGPNLLNDIQQNYPTVIIVVTAGDGGNLDWPKNPMLPSTHPYYNNMGLPYWRVRMNARQNGIDTWVRSNYPRPWTLTEVNFGLSTTRVEKATLGNVTEYRLNLPDGGMANLHANPSTSAMDVRGFNTYKAADVKRVIRQIAKLHYPNTPTLVINYQKPVPEPTHEDHPDHTAVGALTQAAVNDMVAYQCMWQAVYSGYITGNQQPNFPQFLDSQRFAYEAAHSTMRAQGNVTDITVNGIHSTTNTPSGWALSDVFIAPTATTTGRQRGAMDTFHTGFYGKQTYYGVASTGPCNLATAPI